MRSGSRDSIIGKAPTPLGPSLWSTQLPRQRAPTFFPGIKRPGGEIDNCHLLSSSEIRVAVRLLPLFTFIVWTETDVTVL